MGVSRGLARSLVDACRQRARSRAPGRVLPGARPGGGVSERTGDTETGCALKRAGGGFTIFLGSGGGSSSVPPDARSLARMHLREISKKIEAALGDKPAAVDETTRAHLEECHERITKVLNASMQIND